MRWNRTTNRRLLADQSGLEQADDSLALLAGAHQDELGLAVFDGTLSTARSGCRRQVMNCAPNRLTTTGGTPRRVASRPERGHAKRVGQDESGVFHTLVISRIQVIGGRRAAKGLDGLLRDQPATTSNID